MSMERLLALCLVLSGLAWAAAPAMARDCGGTVFADLDGDGRRAAGEPGIGGVAVSDGRRVALTDAAGRYALPGAASATVFVVKPAGYRVRVRGDGLPDFHRAGCGDFALLPAAAAAERTRVLVFSDPQVGSEEEVEYYGRDIVEPASRHRGFDLGLTLGDIVNDAPALYPLINARTARLGLPWLHVAGNHDIDLPMPVDAASLRSFSAAYGPDTFAWEEAHASFVVLDNVIALPGERPAYVGGLREDQFAFLEAWLPHAARGRLLVVAAHVPWFDTAEPGRPATMRAADRERLFALLRDVPQVLLLSGHRHTQRQFFHDAASGWHGAGRLHEYNVGAASGAFWSGVARANGVPDATMADGTPNGYATLEVGPGGRYALAWQPSKLDGGDRSMTAAMALHAPAVLRRGAWPAWGVWANVFMGHEGTRVEYRIGDGAWRPMTKVEAADPRLLVENVRDDLAPALRGRDRTPEAEPSAHLWRGTLATDLAAGAHRVEVRTFDDAGSEHRAWLDYRLAEYPPDPG